MSAPATPPGAEFALRPDRDPDLDWVVARHAAIYAREQGWDQRFAAIVADVVDDYRRQRDAQRERGWIAERDGVRQGCVFVLRHRERAHTAQLRMLLVEPAARGRGLGNRLIGECIAFARAQGYRTLTLWTDHVLAAARRLYAAHGFLLAHSEAHATFGADLIGETWDLRLAP